MKVFDQHVHSYYSFDSNQEIKEYLDRAMKLGLDYFVLTDHCDLNYLDKQKDLFFDIDKQNQELDSLQKEYSKIKILHGIEIGYKPSEINRIKDIINNHHFDLVNFSLHESDNIDYYFHQDFLKYGVLETLNIYFSRELEAIKNFNDFDVFCHLDYGFKTAYLEDHSLSIKQFEPQIIKIMKELIKKDKVLEINTKVQEVLPIGHTLYILELYKRLGGKYLTISSDAHEVERFCSSFDKYINLAKKAGFTHLTYFVNREKHLLKI